MLAALSESGQAFGAQLAERWKAGRSHGYCLGSGRAEPRGLGGLSLGRARLCLSRQFVAVGMQRSGNGGVSRTGDHRNCNAAEWSGGKADESGRARAEAGRYLARNAEKRKCRRGDAGGGIPNNQPASFLPFAGCGSARCCFFRAAQRRACLSADIARAKRGTVKTGGLERWRSSQRRRPVRARCSERHAGLGIRMPKAACRCEPGEKGAKHERRRSACGNGHPTRIGVRWGRALSY